jgi:hypothetical protein
MKYENVRFALFVVFSISTIALMLIALVVPMPVLMSQSFMVGLFGNGILVLVIVALAMAFSELRQQVRTMVE